MARQTKTKKIGDHTYSVTQMDALEALKAQTYLTKILAPIAQEMDIRDEDTFASSFMSALPNILTSVDDPQFHNFFVSMTEQAFCDGSRVSFNATFEGNLKAAYEVFFFVLEVNFADFIKDVIGVDLSKISAS